MYITNLNYTKGSSTVAGELPKFNTTRSGCDASILSPPNLKVAGEGPLRTAKPDL